MTETRWNFLQFNRGEARERARELRVSPLITGLMLNRGLKTRAEMEDFLYGAREPYHDPFLMKDLEKAARRILAAVQAQEQITVYGDYDVDGITASSLLLLYLRRLGARVNTYIPRRKSEGYGLNVEALHTLGAQGTSLVVTVDCGISGVNEVAAAPAGMEIIITDHHSVPEVLPAAYALVNPHQADCAYPFKGLCGVGVAFKLCQGLERLLHPTAPYWEDLTELVAMGTVADIVPLRGENRELVRRGLKAMETTRLLGLQELIAVSACPTHDINSENIGFILAPRLNAVGRLEHAQRAVELLTTEEAGAAHAIAAELNDENHLRQDISKQIEREAEEMLAAQPKVETAIVLAREGWHQGVIGIVASRLVDRYHLPTILISMDGDMAKGSCRSIPTLDLYAAITQCSDLLTQYGGHHQAAGLTLRAADVAAFRQRFTDVVARTLTPADYVPVLDIDLQLDGSERLTLDLLQQLKRLEPFGCENPSPTFAGKHLRLRPKSPAVCGRDGNHLAFFAQYLGDSFSCMKWNSGGELYRLERECTADLAFRPGINVFRGEASVQLDVQAIRQALTVYDYRVEKPDFEQCRQRNERRRLGDAYRQRAAVLQARQQGHAAGPDKEELLRRWLRRGARISLYRNAGAALPPAAEGSGVRLQTYGEAPDPEAEYILLYDLPLVTGAGAPAATVAESGACARSGGAPESATVISAPAEGELPPLAVQFPLPRMIGRTLVLLYGAQDYEMMREALLRQYPDRSYLVTAYHFLVWYLRDHAVATQAELLAQAQAANTYLSETALAVFRELGLLQGNSQALRMQQPVQKYKLEDSATFRAACVTREARLEQLKRAMLVTPHALREAWHRLRGE